MPIVNMFATNPFIHVIMTQSCTYITLTLHLNNKSIYTVTLSFIYTKFHLVYKRNKHLKESSQMNYH